MNSSSSGTKRSGGLMVLILCLAGVLCVLFYKGFNPELALFANDGPLGPTLSRPFAMPGALSGIWNDNYWLGLYNGYYALNFTGLFHFLARGIARVNFLVPISALVLGVCSWVFFRRIGCNARASVLAALAAALNMNFLSNAAWGLPSRGLSLAAAFLALAAIEAGFLVRPILIRWFTSILAGLAIGLSITEGGDNGAIFSLFIAAYAVYRTWISMPSHGKGIALGVGKVIVMACFAAVMANETLRAFSRVAVTGIVGTEQDTQTKEEKWEGNTMWSLPKIETLRMVIPGLFGYRMDTPDGGNYWGRVGEAPSARQQMPRYSGAGEYAGVIVVVIALWVVVESLRSKGQTFTVAERKLIWFWAGMAVVGMLLGWGRHAPFYKLVYALPYFSTVRNPMKFFHAVHLCVMILFAYGLLGMSKRFLDVQGKPGSLLGQLKSWWSKPSPEKTWTWACIAGVALSAVSWFGYVGSRSTLVKHLQESGFPEVAAATQIAKFSAHEVLLFVVFLAVSVVIVTLILSGALAGSRAKWAALLVGLVLVVDLARADMPWIIYSNWKQQYASNPVIDLLKDKPYEHRVAVLPFQVNQQLGMLQQYYHSEWLQHHFPYYSVQSIDIPQEPRPPVDKKMFREALAKDPARLWQLTNVRYLLGLAGPLADMLNTQIDPAQKRFRQHTAFALVRQPNSEFATAETNASGPFAVIEFTGALPRAKLYNNWESIPNEKALLSRLGDTNWNPMETVLLSAEAPKPTAPTATPGKAEILSNPSPKLIEIQTTSDTPAMLLLNDKLEPEWHAYLDGKSAPVLRANYLMRGVQVPAGTHKVAFKYEIQPIGWRIVMACDIAGLLLLGVVIWSAKRKQAAAQVPSALKS